MHHTTGGEHVQFREDLARRAGPEVDQSGQGLGDTQGALHHGIGDRSPAYLIEIEGVAFQGRARDRDAQADFGGDRTAVLAQGAVPVRGVDGLAGGGEGGPDIGQIEQRG
ncbi:hypothetical protein GCM10009828_009320 [Actinoplanes couchii]|uniref:Uncharacterized protein n=1 Tax=Actinoplanes couchii TaxID=403638 RepID=A0ABQ3XIS2_9ACTN|nr:hypothetical protein Aco03nite_067770 [Actinoplanes couchii]